MLCFDHVSFAYPGERTILNDLSFSVSEGEQVGLIGANGAGKSTLMKAALGLITVSGTITIDGLEMNRDNLADIRRRLGYVLQDSDNQMFMPTVLEDMLFGPLNYGMPRPEAEALVDQTLAELNLMHLKTAATTSSPAAKSAWPPLRPSSPCSRRSCSWTSRPRRLTRKTAARSSVRSMRCR